MCVYVYEYVYVYVYAGPIRGGAGGTNVREP